jgi:polyphosphate kinase 2 (PPK2 family)
MPQAINSQNFSVTHRPPLAATNKEWRRAYREINEFERMLVDSGSRLVKLFLHITADKQLRRFRDRLIDPMKHWKLSYDDFRNHTR